LLAAFAACLGGLALLPIAAGEELKIVAAENWLAPRRRGSATMLDLPLDLFATVCQQLDLQDLVRVAETCKRFRYGDGGLETAELPTKLPVVTALLEHAFPRGQIIPSTRPIGCSESWVTYLAGCARQRCCRESRRAIITACLYLRRDSCWSAAAVRVRIWAATLA
jgi:hypothetical protein